MKIFTGELPDIDPQYGIANGETFDEPIYRETPAGFEQIVPHGLPVHPDFAKAISGKIKDFDPAKKADKPKSK